MVRIPAIDRSLGATPRSHSRRDSAAVRRRGPSDYDTPVRGFARELAEVEQRGTADISEPRRDWRTTAYEGPRRHRWKLVDILA